MTPTGRAFIVLGSLLFLTAAWTTKASGQTTGAKNPPLVIASMAGRDLFAFYCASCHGRDGKGHGPTAPALRTPPPDLTTLARRHGGQYPAEYVHAVISSGDKLVSSSHGSTDMPVWGPIFRALETNDARVKTRLANLVVYLGSLQAP